MGRGRNKRTFKDGRVPGMVLNCTRCGETKDENEFYFNHQHFRYDSQCIKCKKAMEIYVHRKKRYIPKSESFRFRAEKDIEPDSLSIEYAKKILNIGDYIINDDSKMEIIKITTYGAFTINEANESKESFLWIDLLEAIKEKRVIYSA